MYKILDADQRIKYVKYYHLFSNTGYFISISMKKAGRARAELTVSIRRPICCRGTDVIDGTRPPMKLCRFSIPQRKGKKHKSWSPPTEGATSPPRPLSVVEDPRDVMKSLAPEMKSYGWYVGPGFESRKKVGPVRVPGLMDSRHSFDLPEITMKQSPAFRTLSVDNLSRSDIDITMIAGDTMPKSKTLPENISLVLQSDQPSGDGVKEKKSKGKGKGKGKKSKQPSPPKEASKGYYNTQKHPRSRLYSRMLRRAKVMPFLDKLDGLNSQDKVDMGERITQFDEEAEQEMEKTVNEKKVKHLTDLENQLNKLTIRDENFEEENNNNEMRSVMSPIENLFLDDEVQEPRSSVADAFSTSPLPDAICDMPPCIIGQDALALWQQLVQFIMQDDALRQLLPVVPKYLSSSQIFYVMRGKSCTQLHPGRVGHLFLGEHVACRFKMAIKLYWRKTSGPSLEHVVREAAILEWLKGTGVVLPYYGLVRVEQTTHTSRRYLPLALVTKFIGHSHKHVTTLRSLFINHALLKEKAKNPKSKSRSKPPAAPMTSGDWINICITLAKGLELVHENDVIMNGPIVDNIIIHKTMKRCKIYFGGLSGGLYLGNLASTRGAKYDITETDSALIKYRNDVIPPETDPDIGINKCSFATDIFYLGYVFHTLNKRIKLPLRTLALECMRSIPENRPTLELVVRKLELLKEKLHKNDDVDDDANEEEEL